MSYLIGISGGSASGKTSTCKIVQKQLGHHVLILSMDSFYLGLGNTTKNNQNTTQNSVTTNFDHPSSFDWELLYFVLDHLKRGIPVEIPIYNFSTHQREGSVITKPEKCIIFEGILSLYDPKIRDLFDIKIFVDTPADIRLIRRIKRDISERNRTLKSILEQYEKTVIPSYDQFIEPTKKYADLIIPRGKTNLTAISVMVNQIKGNIGN